MDFARLIHPIAPEAFFEGHYEQRLLLLRRGQPGYYDELLRETDLDELLARPGLNPAYLNLSKQGAPVPAQQWTRVDAGLPGAVRMVIDPDAILRLFHQGTTIVINHAEQAVPRLAAACQAFEQQTHIRVQANVYLAPAGAKGFARHWDAHGILAMQVKGAKHWRLDGTGEDAPDGAAVEPRETREFDLEDGDLLYLPRGLTHEVFTSEAVSIHVNFALKPRSGADVIESIASHARADPFFGRAVPNRFAAEADRIAYAEKFTEQLRALIDRHPAGTLLEREGHAFAARQIIDRRGMLTTALRIDALTIDSVVRRRPGSFVPVARDQGGTVLEFGGRPLAIPAFVDAALLLQDQPFAIGAIEGMITAKGKIELVRTLARAGYLEIVAA